MESLKFRTMDIFRYAIPGSFMLFVICLVVKEIHQIKDVQEVIINKINLQMASFIVIISYVIGFCLDMSGDWVHNKFGRKLRQQKIQNRNLNITRSQKYVLVREMSKENFLQIVTWDMLKGMAFNLSVAMIVLFFISVVKIFQTQGTYYEWIILAFTSLCLCYMLLYRANRISEWSQNDLENTVDIYNLIEKAKSFNSK